jgi:hypothetical protein
MTSLMRSANTPIDLGVSVFLQFDLLIYFYHHVVFEKGREEGLTLEDEEVAL